MSSLVICLPEIAISPAPPQLPAPEPYSPFSDSYSQNLREPDSPRPVLLSPPPTGTPHLRRQLSPLRPDDAPISGRGIERERFEALLRASRERNAAVGCKKSPDLRKEIAVKVHKSKQMERRALFIAKLQAPPSPSATLVPKTPPESPAIFHYSLPSPGLESPLAVFELLALESPLEDPHVWVEQVDFRMSGQENIKRPHPPKMSVLKRNILPSLDQITARLGSSVHDTSRPPSSPRLPAFLRSGKKSGCPSPPDATVQQRRALPVVGRLQFPSTMQADQLADADIASSLPRLPLTSPLSVAPSLQITTTVVPHTSSRSPDALTESNLRAFVIESRERMAKDMLTRLRRRTLPPAQLAVPGRPPEEERKIRRHSAPPELPLKERVGFCKPIQDLPGAF